MTFEFSKLSFLSGQGGESDAGSARQDPTVSGGWIDLGKDEKQVQIINKYRSGEFRDK